MIKLYKLFFSAVLSTGLALCALEEKPQESIETVSQVPEIIIRVLLKEVADTKKVDWCIKSATGFVVFSRENQKKRHLYKRDTLSVSVHNGVFYINGKKYAKDQIFIMPDVPSGAKSQVMLELDDTHYLGAFVLTMHNDGAYLVNHLDLEDYVRCVLPAESWPGWPYELNKAFCIMFRSYGIATLLEDRKIRAKRGIVVPYDIKNTNVHQIYKGYEPSAEFEKIIKETRGLVVAYDDKPILAMFDGCCGGVIPAKKRGIDFVKAPYLKRTYPCTYCKDSKLYRWEIDFMSDYLGDYFKKEFPKFTRIRDIKVMQRDDAGIVTKVCVVDTKRSYEVSGAKFKSLVRELKSCCFSIKRHGDIVTIKGKGYGHHMGVCQWGARQMIEQGKNYKEVLKFYYPGTSFMRLKKKPKK